MRRDTESEFGKVPIRTKSEAIVTLFKAHSQCFVWILAGTILGLPPLLAQTQPAPPPTPDAASTQQTSTATPGQATTPQLPGAGQAPPPPPVPDQRLEVYGYVMTRFWLQLRDD